MKQHDTRLFDQGESVTERQHGVDEGKWVGSQERLTAAHVPADAGAVQLRIAICGVHRKRGKVFEPVRRQYRVEVEGRTLGVQVHRFWLRVRAQPGNID